MQGETGIGGKTWLLGRVRQEIRNYRAGPVQGDMAGCKGTSARVRARALVL